LDTHSKPQKTIIYDRWIFRNTKQQQDESASQFIVRLKKLAETCEYTNNDEEVRDQFVCGCYEKKLMEKFLRMPKLTIKDIAEATFTRTSQRASKRNSSRKSTESGTGESCLQKEN